jgi:outer membrane protein OmpA-like peptidoglycan-associated protein
MFAMTSGSILAAGLLLGSYAICGAQSHDPKKPTPLGPGVNKGNVDNVKNGPNYYYFYGGPGHVDMHYAFKEMGVFGNPLRQALNFDLFEEDDKPITQNSIISVGKMETLVRPGNLPNRLKIIIRVQSPNAVIRLGGYYEIEVTGAATFDGKATGAGVKPEDTRLAPGAGVALTNGTTSLTNETTSLTNGTTSLTNGKPVSLYKPVGALIKVQESPREFRLTLAADVLFDFNKAAIRPDAKAALDRVAEIIRSNSRGVVKIGGFTDSKGAPDYNLRLSAARAESVQKWLIEREGLHDEKFATHGFGATHFAVPNTKADGADDPAARQKNRRVEIVVQRKA